MLMKIPKKLKQGRECLYSFINEPYSYKYMIKYRKLYSYYLVPTIVARKSDSKGTYNDGKCVSGGLRVRHT